MVKYQNPLNVKIITLSLKYVFVVVIFLYEQISERA